MKKIIILTSVIFLLSTNTLCANDKLISSTNLNLLENEKSYLKEKKVIKVCTNPNWAPIEFTQDNKPQGVSIDILKEIAAKLDIKLQFIKTSSWNKSQEYLKDTKCDILPAAVKTAKREEYANFTKPYLKYNLAIVTKDDKPLVNYIEEITDKTMSRKNGSGLISKLKKIYPNLHIKETKGYIESFEDVQNGDAYFTVATLPILSYYKKKYSLDNLQIAGYLKMPYRLSIAVIKEDKILLNILDKAILTIPQEKYNTVSNKWENSVVIKNIDNHLIWEAAGILIVLIIIALYRQRELKKYNTALLLAKKEIEILNSNLEKRVKEEVDKNRHKDQQILHQSKLAQMGEMISMIAHQWRQPLTSISATTNNLLFKLMMEQYDKKEFETEIGLIADYSQHLSKTIDDFRGFFKTNKNKEETTFTKIVNSTLDIIKISIENKNIKIITNLNCKEEIETYPNEIKQVVLNLIKNAEDVLLEREIKNPIIEIKTICGERCNNPTLIIKDNGGGVPPDIRERIFDPYFSTKLEKDGTGLGLYMSKVIIEEHCGGKLTVSNNNEGAVFKIEFKK